MKNTTSERRGTFVYDNMLAKLNGQPALTIYEAPLFTDADIVDEAKEGYEPYTFLNSVAKSVVRKLQPAIVVRIDHCLPNPILEPGNVTDDSTYHGGHSLDEVAALIALILGIRAKAGNLTREFAINGDVRGQPLYYESEWPTLLNLSDSLLIPSLQRTVSLVDIGLFKTYTQLDISTAIAIMRCARLYQNAMWIVDSTPEIAWLLLVSSVETAANCWRVAKDSPVERLTSSKPNLALLLTNSGGDELMQKVAIEIADYMGATKKFVDFLINFLPPAPDKRAASYSQIVWEQKEMKKSLSAIYNYRSQALHQGIPFPAPLCNRPFLPDTNCGYDEKPIGSYGMQGGSWNKKDLPMYIHVFEYVARNAIINWWKSIVYEGVAE